jgi:hypothetical protein
MSSLGMLGVFVCERERKRGGERERQELEREKSEREKKREGEIVGEGARGIDREDSLGMLGEGKSRNEGTRNEEIERCESRRELEKESDNK